MEKEEWKDIAGYEGFYQVSNKGRIKSLERQITYKNGVVATHKGNIKSQPNDCKTEYRITVLSKENKLRAFKISRLVAQHFIPNPYNYKVVNHKDGNKKNDCEENLEWCTPSYNNIHAFQKCLRKKKNSVSGVFYEKRRGKWAAYLYRENKNIFLGRFKNKKQAIYAKIRYQANVDK